jgi:electron transport complex protein RnfE
MEKPKLGKTFFNGVFTENPTFRLLIGMCAPLAITTTASNAIGMGLATTFVLVCSNAVISLLRNIIPKEVRLPCFIVIVAGFVTIVDLVMARYLPSLYAALGLFLQLIVVNCIILGRAEMFASKYPLLPSIVDGLGMGMGFTGALLIISTVREIFGNLSWFGRSFAKGSSGMLFFILPAGAFFVLGLLTALINKLSDYKLSRNKAGCAGCPAASTCGEKACSGEVKA